MFNELQEIENKHIFQEVTASAHEAVFMLEIRSTGQITLISKIWLDSTVHQNEKQSKVVEYRLGKDYQRAHSHDNNSGSGIDDEFFSDDQPEHSRVRSNAQGIEGTSSCFRRLYAGIEQQGKTRDDTMTSSGPHDP